jgi:hypothetical protein
LKNVDEPILIKLQDEMILKVHHPEDTQESVVAPVAG